jgi:hypothetical protein
MTWCSSWQASLAVAEDASVDAGEATPSGLLLQLDGFEGPLDLLLDLARGQKVDLARISILSLVEQYLAVIEGARRVRLELAADWLVMAAWLTWLKSRLLLPAGSGAAEEGEACWRCRRRGRSPAGSAHAPSLGMMCSPAVRGRTLPRPTARGSRSM